MYAGARLLAALEASEEPMLLLTKLSLSRGPEFKSLTINENWGYNFRREKLRRDYHRKMRDAGVDDNLCPANSGVGTLQGAPKYVLELHCNLEHPRSARCQLSKRHIC